MKVAVITRRLLSPQRAAIKAVLPYFEIEVVPPMVRVQEHGLQIVLPYTDYDHYVVNANVRYACAIVRQLTAQDKAVSILTKVRREWRLI